MEIMGKKPQNPVVKQAKEGEGRFSFCNGCTVYCYMRSSLLWRYPVESVLMAGHYVRERVRQRVSTVVSPAPRGIIPPLPAKRTAWSAISIGSSRAFTGWTCSYRCR